MLTGIPDRTWLSRDSEFDNSNGIWDRIRICDAAVSDNAQSV